MSTASAPRQLWRDLLALAEAAAREAGGVLRQRDLSECGSALETGTAGLRTAVKSSATDLVTEMDTASERRITARILAQRPADAILGEEGTSDTPGVAGGSSGTGRSAGSGVRWIIDPIDGTTNYVYGHPFWAVSVAAEVDGETVAGVVHAPALGETYTAVRGGGAHLNGQAIAVRSPADLAQALVGTGFGYAAGRRAEQGRVVSALLPQVRDIRRGGSAALDLCYVACGRLDAYYERGVQLWDIAAGALIAAEAGAKVGDGADGKAGEQMTLAAPPALYGQLAVSLGVAVSRPTR